MLIPRKKENEKENTRDVVNAHTLIRQDISSTNLSFYRSSTRAQHPHTGKMNTLGLLLLLLFNLNFANADDLLSPNHFSITIHKRTLQSCEESHGSGFQQCGPAESGYCYNPTQGQVSFRSEIDKEKKKERRKGSVGEKRRPQADQDKSGKRNAALRRTIVSAATDLGAPL